MSRFSFLILSLLVWFGRPLGAEATEPPLRLHAESEEEGNFITLFFQNTSDEPVMLYLDARRVEVQLRDGRRTLGRCRLPGANPGRLDDRRFISLLPGQQAGERLDLRLVCFGALLGRLEQARTLSVTYRAPRGRDRYGVATWSGSIGPVEIARPAAREATGDEPGLPPAGGPLLTLHHLGRDPDVARGTSVAVTLELRGPQHGRLPVAIRPEQFIFSVQQPDGDLEQCQLPTSRVDPLPEFYDTLGRRRLGLSLGDFCPPQTFAIAGVYEVRPFFTSNHGEQVRGSEAWTGQISGSPFLVRVRQTGAGAVDPVEIVVPHSQSEGGADAP